eukprot:TRINITY_DN43317_c0_g1_i1.p2 TRINITY_DN43317_c0_g1~~TRINITY_DN43317_c0_g1_i1.p2  ORF type:complete len:299 (+),score=111.17 TRINITY_DN43317_c0_g1_i1:61-897(+)
MPATGKKRARSPPAERPQAPVLHDLWADESPVQPQPKSRRMRVSAQKSSEARRADALKVGAQLPDASQSYNPDPEQHRRAVANAVRQLERDEERQARLSAKIRPNIAVKKGCVGDDITGPDWEEEIEGEAPDPFKAPKRKTRQQRNKTRRHLDMIRAHRKKKQDTRILGEADRLEDIKAEMDKEKAEKAIKLEKKRAIRLKRHPRIGKQRFKEPALDICDESDLQPSLRQQGKVKAGVRDAIKLRYEAFQRRRIVPSGPKKSHKRNPVKFFALTKYRG